MVSDIRRRLRLLTPSERGAFAVLTGLGLLNTFLEWVGGASVFLLVAALSRPDEVARHPMVAPLLAALGVTGPRGTRIAAATGMAGFHLLRVVTGLVLLRYQTRTGMAVRAALMSRVFELYLRAPWLLHVRRNSSELIRNTLENAAALFVPPTSAVALAQEVVLLVGLLGLMGAVAPLQTIAAGAIFAVVIAIALRITRRASARAGARRYEIDRVQLQSVQQGLGGFREVRVLGREAHFRDAFAGALKSGIDLSMERATLDAAPRSIMEGVFVLAAMVAMAILAAGDDQSSVLPLLGLYAYTGFRAIPAVQRILGHTENIRYTVAITDPLVADLERGEHVTEPDDEGGPPLPFTDRICVEDASFAYEEGRPILQGIRLAVARGQSVGIVGRTGAGKSTLLDLLLGLLDPTSGRITVDGQPLGPARRAWRKNLGYVPQSVFLTDDTLRRNVAFGIADDEIDDERVWAALRLAQLEGFVVGLPDGLATMVGERGVRLSGGERQRVAIARALYRDPQVIIFDEATSSLDPATERDLVRALGGLRGDRTLFLVTHRLATVMGCDRVFLLEDGRVAAAGTYRDLIENSPAFRALAALADEPEPTTAAGAG